MLFAHADFFDLVLTGAQPMLKIVIPTPSGAPPQLIYSDLAQGGAVVPPGAGFAVV